MAMTKTLLNTEPWYDLLAKMASNSDDVCFPHLLAKACKLLTHYQSTVIIAYPKGRLPVHIYNNLPSEQLNITLTPYFAGAYLVDPYYELGKNQSPNGIYRLKDLAPDHFYQSEYFRNYYAHTQLCDETGLLININPELCIIVSLGHRENDEDIIKLQLKNLQTCHALLVALCQKFWKENGIGMEMTFGPQNTPQPKYGASLDNTFMNFGRDFLSDRECDVVRLILKGHSSKSIARVLDISPDTVKVHRKRFHTKLEVSSQAELFSLFLNSISLVPLDSDDDPLTYYFAQHPRQGIL